MFCDLSGMRAVVTGASSGIGRAIAIELASGGADVLVHYRSNQAGAEAAMQQIRDLGRESEALSADLAVSDQRERFLQEVQARWESVDVWVNNAGVDLLTGAGAKLGYDEKLRRLLDVDVAATVFYSKQVGTWMRQRGEGVIINIGWDQAAVGMEGDSGELFALSKSAIMAFSRSLALSLAPEVRVHCIAPGWIRTAWGETAGDHWQQRVLRETPLHRWGVPEDVAHLARFLASREAAYLTGQVWNVNGGAVRG